MIRPQLKDMYGGGHDVSLDKKKAKAAMQPPMNASPGELRLWRKLNGCLTDEEKKVDALEHAKAKSRANLAGKPRNGLSPAAPLRRGPSDEILQGEEFRQQQLIERGGGGSPANSSRKSFSHTPSRTKATPPRARAPVSKQTPKAASPRPSRAGSPRPPAKTPVLDAAKQQQEKRRAAAKEAAEKAALLRQKQAAAAAARKKQAEAEQAAAYDEPPAEYGDEGEQQQEEQEPSDRDAYAEADEFEAAEAAAAALEAVEAVQGSDSGYDDNDREAESPESNASSVQVTGAPPKARAAPASEPAPAVEKKRAVAEGPADLGRIQELCGSLSLADKKKLKVWLGGRIEVEELQDLFDRS